MSLLSKQVVVVTGKGGTGKTTAAAALGAWAARQGKKCIVVECNGAQHIPPLFGRQSTGYAPLPLGPNLSTMSITAEEAIEDYVVQQIKVRSLYKLVFKNRIMGPFMDAVPGLHDSVHLGKVFDLIEQQRTNGAATWDMVIVDAPATGHGLHMLQSTRSMMELTRMGPVYEGTKLVHDVLADTNRTAIVLTCLPEHLPVSETIELEASLRSTDYEVAAVLLNGLLSQPLPREDEWSEHAAELLNDACAAVQEAAQLTARAMRRRKVEQTSLQRLLNRINAPVAGLPLILKAQLGPSEVHSLSLAIEKGLA